MTDIQFAKEHLGEYFRFRGYRGYRDSGDYEDYEVRVIGYDATGIGKSVIIDYPRGWWIEYADSTDVIHEELCETWRCFYASWEELM